MVVCYVAPCWLGREAVMSWLSKLFPETVEIEYQDENGQRVKKRVLKTEFDALANKALAEGKATVVDACRVHILDPVDGEVTEDRLIGEDIDRTTYDRLKDADGDIYVIAYYEAGDRKTRTVPKAMWDQAASTFSRMDQEREQHIQKAIKSLGLK
jgi:hypothetical protein